MGTITNLTKRNIISLFKNGYTSDDIWGANYIEYDCIGVYENDYEFLERIYDLDNLPSKDPRYENAKADIIHHTILNDDYDKCWFFTDDRFGLCGENDEIYLHFLCEIFDPYVRDESENWETFLKLVDDLLKEDGWELFECGKISGKAKFGYRRYNPDNYRYIPFSIRYEKLLKNKNLILTIPMSVREKIKQFLNNSDQRLIRTDDSGFNYNSFISTEFFNDVNKFYEPKYFDGNNYVSTDNINSFIMDNYPEKVFDIIEYYSYQKQDESFIKFINTIFDNNDLPFILEGFRISESNSFSIEDSTDKAKINDEDLKRIIESAKELFSKHEMELACEKIWDAFERVKTYYYPDISDKKGSVEKLVRGISHDSYFYNLFNTEFKALTDMGNKFRIRHHEKGKININDENYYEYFYNRCLSLLILVLNSVESQTSI